MRTLFSLANIILQICHFAYNLGINSNTEIEIKYGMNFNPYLLPEGDEMISLIYEFNLIFFEISKIVAIDSM